MNHIYICLYSERGKYAMLQYHKEMHHGDIGAGG